MPGKTKSAKENPNKQKQAKSEGRSRPPLVPGSSTNLHHARFGVEAMRKVDSTAISHRPTQTTFRKKVLETHVEKSSLQGRKVLDPLAY